MVLPVGVRHSRAEAVLRWKFSKGEKIAYVIHVDNATKMTSGKDVFELNDTLVLDAVWTVTSVDSSGKAKIVVTIDRIRFRAVGKGEAALRENVDYDSRNKGPAWIHSTLGSALGAEFTLMMDPQGRISGMTIPDKLVKALGTNPPQELAGFFGGSFTAEGLKRTLVDWIPPFSIDTVLANKPWTDVRPLDEVTTLSQTCTYQGTQTKNNRQVERINLTLKVTNKPRPGKSSDIISSQDAKGAMYFDSNRGRAVDYELRQKLASESYVAGRRYAETQSERIVRVSLANESGNR
jgi:hypothetical protein